MIKLSKRLQTIANYIEDGNKIIDIGCDHAYLSIYLALNKKNIKVIASDINQNAYNIALNNVKNEKLENIITLRLGNGLEVVTKDEIDTIIISGLGSMTIVGILKNGIDKLANVKTIIIQSNTDLYYLRKNITKLNYYIAKEETIKENGQYYTIIVFKKGNNHYSNDDLLFGPLSLKKDDQNFKNMTLENYQKLKKINENISSSKIIIKTKMHLKIKKVKKILKRLSS